MPTKNTFFLLSLSTLPFTSVFKDNMSLRSHITVGLLMEESGSRSGSVHAITDPDPEGQNLTDPTDSDPVAEH
jgi:hypothetical protein